MPDRARDLDMKKLGAAVIVGVVAWLAPASPALACSCASPDKPTLRGLDAAVTARLVDVDPKEPPPSGSFSYKAKHTYKLLRVYKGSRTYNLREGETLVLRTTAEASCGLPSNEGRRYGLGLYEGRGELNGSLCSTISPREMRRAAERSGNARATVSGCGSQS